MKKYIVLLIALLSIMLNAQAQNSKVVTAWNYMGDGEWLKAKAAIDAASADPSTSVKPKTWLYKGKVYVGIAKDSNLLKQYPDAMETALAAYTKALDLDVKKDYRDEIQVEFLSLRALFFNSGAKAFNKRQYDGAYSGFKNAIKIDDISNVRFGYNSYDTLAHFYAAVTALSGKKYDSAKVIFEQMTTLKSIPTGPKYDKIDMGDAIYTSLVSIYESEKDTAKALATIDKGLAIYPKDVALNIDQVSIYLSQRKYDIAVGKIEAALKLDSLPQREVFLFNEGLSYEKMNDTANAAKYYIKAVQYKSDYFDAEYELGAMYYNSAVIINKQMNKLGTSAADQAKYDKLRVQRDAMFDKSLPVLEKALDMANNEKGSKADKIKQDKLSTIGALKELYTRQNKMDKAKQMADLQAQLNAN